MRFLTISIALLVVLNAVTLFFLFHMHKGNGHGLHGGRGGPVDYITKELKLDEKQQGQFANLRDVHHDFLKKMHREDEQLHELYFSLIKTDNPDKLQVDSVAGLIGNQRKMFALTAFDHFRQLRAICRDDQKKWFDNIVDEMGRMIVSPIPNGPSHH